MQENKEDWAIVQLTKNKKEFLEEVVEDSFSSVQFHVKKKKSSLKAELARAVYMEKGRLSQTPWKVDPKDEKTYWANIKNQILNPRESSIEELKLKEIDLVKSISKRYAYEIAGNFNLKTYGLSTNAVPFILARLLNTANNGWRGLFAKENNLHNIVELLGNLDHIRNLASKGTVVLVPTHFSNIDSIVIGYGLYLAGLPPFLYGAGLNLYNNSLVGYFINRLGAYTVDRRKKNLFYIEALKSYSRVALQRDCHSLFFPGGTRSRSGAMEKNLKLGLLGTAIEAQQHNFQINKSNKVFILPLVTGYHFVLEAASLINEHLKRTGKEKYYIDNDQFSNWQKIMRFGWDFFSRGSKITMSFGKPMDIFGNYVDFDGVSLDKNGNEIAIEKYFISNGQFQPNAQRDAEYTRLLGKRITEEYFIENNVLSSHLVSFTAFQCLKNKYPSRDLYSLLRLHDEERKLDLKSFMRALSFLQEKLRELKAKGKLKISEEVGGKTKTLLRDGLKNMGLYHSKNILTVKDRLVHIDDMNLLYYYHNRTSGYNLEKELAKWFKTNWE